VPGDGPPERGQTARSELAVSVSTAFTRVQKTRAVNHMVSSNLALALLCSTHSVTSSDQVAKLGVDWQGCPRCPRSRPDQGASIACAGGLRRLPRRGCSAPVARHRVVFTLVRRRERKFIKVSNCGLSAARCSPRATPAHDPSPPRPTDGQSGARGFSLEVPARYRSSNMGASPAGDEPQADSLLAVLTCPIRWPGSVSGPYRKVRKCLFHRHP
jgi:hypothetical protein